MKGRNGSNGSGWAWGILRAMQQWTPWAARERRADEEDARVREVAQDATLLQQRGQRVIREAFVLMDHRMAGRPDPGKRE